MLDLIAAPENFPFVVALCVMLLIALLEGVGMILGMALSHILDSLIPEFDFPDLDADAVVAADLNLETPVGLPEKQVVSVHGVLGKTLSWIRLGKVPVLILLVVFLTGFGVAGLVLQILSVKIFGGYMASWLASIPALFLAVPAMRVFGGWLSVLMPSDETSAVSVDTLVGLAAEITLGTARVGHPAEARLKDGHGQTHYVMVEPDTDDVEFVKGEAVLLIERNGATFRAISGHNYQQAD